MKERLQKVLSARGVASRRAAEELIASGRVNVNGQTATLGQMVDPEEDTIRVDGELAGESRRLYLALNKPIGYVSSLRSTHGERTVMELLDVPARVYPVGRLDKDTSGLLLLSNDGDWANIITHPRYRVEKEYLALVRGSPSADAIRRLREGVRLPDGAYTAPAAVSIIAPRGSDSLLSVTVGEGKKRQIRLMAEAVGHPVITLCRTRVGPVRLESLPEGQWRYLDPGEVESVRAYGGRDTASAGGGAEAAYRHRRTGRGG